MPPDPLTYQRAAVLRRKLTPPEARLWARLKGGRLHGIGFRRQHPIGIYILDFYCASAKTAFEIDGAGHDHPDQVAKDRRRTEWLNAQGIWVVRYPAVAIRDDLDSVLAGISAACEQRRAARGGTSPSTASRSPSPSPSGDGEEKGC